jgi:hypothetical protein
MIQLALQPRCPIRRRIASRAGFGVRLSIPLTSMVVPSEVVLMFLAGRIVKRATAMPVLAVLGALVVCGAGESKEPFQWAGSGRSGSIIARRRL